MKHSVIVIGLGRFGSAAARELMALGHEVLAIDDSETKVNEIATDVTHAVELDASDEQALRDVGAADFEHAIVAISSNTEASIFATMALKNLGVRNVIAKAATTLHGKILERVGASRVVYPERDTGASVAHSFSIPHVLDYIDVAPRFGIVKVHPPASFVGKTLREIDIPGQLSLTPIALRRGNNVTVNPHRDERIAEDDELILIGLDEKLELLER
jgi:trk system potassium uptake protein TrkA